MLNKNPYGCPADLLQQAQAERPAATAVAGAASTLVLQSARMAEAAGLIRPLLIGEPEAVVAAAKAIDWDIDARAIIAAGDEVAACQTAVALARQGEVEAIMKGQVHTDALIRAVVNREQGLRTGRRISHVFYMTIAGREGAVSITDAAVNVAPSPDVRLDILRNAVDLHLALGQKQPRVAVLSATEVAGPGMPSSEEARDIAARAKTGEVERAHVEGPFALDVAISPEAAALKGISGEVAGRADILLAPNIETGNALFKSLVYFAGATAAGLVLGAKVPIMLTSRADPPEARLAAAALASVFAAHNR